MTASIIPNQISSTEPARHTVERVLSTIAATARLDGMVAPRRISFDEPRVGEPLAVLSLTWPSLHAMRPWLEWFNAGQPYAHRQDDGSMHYVAYGDYHGWSVSLNALDTARCTCGAERVHQTGCPAVDWVDELMADTPPVPANPHYVCGMVDSPPCPTGEHGPDTWRRYATPAQQAAIDAVAVSPEGIPEHLADHFAVLNPDVPIPYVPVAWPTGVAANADECARLNAESDARRVLDGMGNWTTPGAASSTAAVGAAIERTARSIHRVPTEAHLRNGHEPHADHEPTDRDARIVDVVTVDLDLRDGGRGDPGMASLMPPQMSFAEAPERLRTVRD
ncbi:MAG TPA: hypothetical protein VGP91_15065, partial [Actinoplanes sp.]|nr:hypothetical protein [Actinoplanes sp.]